MSVVNGKKPGVVRPTDRAVLSARRLATLSFGTLWGAAVVVGFVLLFLYDATPGIRGDSPERWPEASALRPEPGMSTLVMAVHPHCPCTRASLSELALVMARLRDRVRAHVLFTLPPGAERSWAEGGLWSTASDIPGVIPLIDSDGMEAAHFGIETSGHTLLYDRDGALLFSGGITPSRGHEGDSAGRDAIVSLVENGASPLNITPVYGCALREAPPVTVSGVTPCPK